MHGGVRVVYSTNSGCFLAGNQVFPVSSGEANAASQSLIDACLAGDTRLALQLLADPIVDVDFVGAVNLRSRRTELVPGGESAHRVTTEFEEFPTDVTALFVAAHSGNLLLVRKLLGVGADVNKRLFRGYAMTAAVREDYLEILEVLLKAEACEPACEEALLEASYVGRARHAELLMGSNKIGTQVAVHALVTACCRGFLDVVSVLIKCGVDANAMDRMLLLSSKPYLHLNVDCNAIIAAIVSRQTSVIKLLLKEGVRIDTKVRLGAWSWDPATGDELKVGAGLAEPYDITWCAVEYFEETGTILRLLLKHISPNKLHLGRTLIYHAILCNNPEAVSVLSSCGANIEFPLKVGPRTEIRPIHLAAKLGAAEVLRRLISSGCSLNTMTDAGETAVMICTRYKHKECLQTLASAGADFGLRNSSGESAGSIAGSTKWTLGFQEAVLEVIRAGNVVKSSNPSVFSPVLFVVKAGDLEALKTLTKQPGRVSLDDRDEDGYTAAMVAASNGQIEAFKWLVRLGANISISNKQGETALTMSKANGSKETLEKIVLDCALEEEESGGGARPGPTGSTSYALHCAARRGDHASVRKLIKKGYDPNSLNEEGYTPLMLAAREGSGSVCQFLISRGARCDVAGPRGETALSLARRAGPGNDAERVILDELARQLVLCGHRVMKYTKGGKGSPHRKKLRMVGATGVLRWGRSSRRNVVCADAQVGASWMFLQDHRPKKRGGGGAGARHDPGLFHVVTRDNREVHFVCEGGLEVAKLWVRGIKLVTREAIFGKSTLRSMFSQELDDQES